MSVSVEKASDPTDSLSEDKGWCKRIGKFPERNLLSPGVQETDQKTT